MPHVDFNRTSVVGTVFLLTLASQGAQAQTYSDDAGGSVTFYGQVSPTYQSFDDGSESFGNLADNSHSNTRVGLNIDQRLQGNTALRFNFETALGAPGSSSFSQETDPIWNWEKTDLRKLELIWSADWGTVWVGQGSQATDGTDSMDLSGTTIASSRAVGDSAGGYFFRQTDGDISGVKIGDAFAHYDGTRRMRIRYDSPKFGGRSDDTGINFEASYGYEALKEDDDNTYYDVAAYYAEVFDSVEVAAAAGYLWIEGDDSTTENWSASVSLLHTPSGLNGSIAGGGNPDGGSFFYAKGGWIADLFNVGATAFSIDYANGTDNVSDGADAEMWGIQAVQKFDDQNLEAYIAYADYSFADKSDVEYKDANSVLAGVRWKF
ncbi:hypothetical protein [Tropicimonas marinistellae]|uniref:hypothetical protein n=1 Tax=Tropicimonas marinistellae TaxID=1739787 RepID=UPI000836682E|nr:hypothetical protein [Tropicimonas marinistellae]